MPANNPNAELLMALSADTMMRLLEHPKLDPTLADLPELAFIHAARLLEINHRFATNAKQLAEAKTSTKH